MITEVILGKLNIIAFLIAMFIIAVGTPSYAGEQIETDKSDFVEIEILDDLNHKDNESKFVYAKSTISEYEAGSIKSRDILRTIPSINTKDNKVLGLVMPPFAYFKTKF